MTDQTVEKITEIKTDLARRVMDELDQNVYLCYQCLKCTSGCPVGKFFDYQPHQIMRALQFGVEEIALNSETIWLCASCQTCTTRCPQDLQIAAIMDFLAQEALARGIKPQIPEADIFARAFMREVHLWGRSYELGMMAEMKLTTGKLLDDLDLGMKMISKRKFPFLPVPSKPPKKVTPIETAAESVAYYPGCALHATSPEFHTSAIAACEAIDLDLVEPKGWVCCGSSAAHRREPEEAIRLPLENLRIIEQAGFEEVTMPCAACFNRHKAALYESRKHPEKRKKVEDKLGYLFKDDVAVHTLSETILRRAGADKVAERVKKPLTGLNVVCYYGCLLTRPPEITEVEHPENPTDMDELVSALGANVLDWSYKTCCCGAAHSLVRPDIVLDLSKRILDEAKKAGADVIAVACPLCHTNLDGRQTQMDMDEPVPVMFFTQLLALGFDLPAKDIALNKNLIDPRPLLKEKGLIEKTG
jgi:heterodisulfide reductase subunit B